MERLVYFASTFFIFLLMFSLVAILIVKKLVSKENPLAKPERSPDWYKTWPEESPLLKEKR